jgi:hypothetical protein
MNGIKGMTTAHHLIPYFSSYLILILVEEP